MGSTCCFGEGHDELAQLSPLFVLLCACHAAFALATSVFVLFVALPWLLSHLLKSIETPSATRMRPKQK